MWMARLCDINAKMSVSHEYNNAHGILYTNSCFSTNLFFGCRSRIEAACYQGVNWRLFGRIRWSCHERCSRLAELTLCSPTLRWQRLVTILDNEHRALNRNSYLDVGFEQIASNKRHDDDQHLKERRRLSILSCHSFFLFQPPGRARISLKTK